MRRFTRVEADRQLLQVRPLVLELQRRALTFRERRTEPLAQELRALLGELAELGVEVKDPESGLIDFRSLRGGREVYLCWRPGDGDRIQWWHELEAGFAGRTGLDG